MFSSDNGPFLGGEGGQSFARYNCHLHGQKSTVYEGGIRTPMLMRWPEPPRNVPPPPPAELFNIAEDPREENNLANRHPDIARRLLTDLEIWFQEVEAERATIDDAW